MRQIQQWNKHCTIHFYLICNLFFRTKIVFETIVPLQMAWAYNNYRPEYLYELAKKCNENKVSPFVEITTKKKIVKWKEEKNSSNHGSILTFRSLQFIIFQTKRKKLVLQPKPEVA